MACCTSRSRNEARYSGLKFTVVMVLVLAIHTFFMYISAMLADGSRRPYIWISWGTSYFLSVVNIGFIITWTVAAARDNLHWMTISLTGLAVHLAGTVVYMVINEIVASLSEPTLSDIFALDLHFGEALVEPLCVYAAVIVFGIECFFVAAMGRYTESCKASIDAREEEESKEKSDESSPDTPSGVGTSAKSPDPA